MTAPKNNPDARTNRQGSICPAWCTSDHGKVDVHFSDRMGAHESYAEPYARVMKPRDGDEYVVASAAAGLLLVNPCEAGDLAGLIEALADCTPAQLRALADEVRQAALVLAGGAR